MQNIKDAQIVVNNKNLIQRANIYIKHNAEFKNINANFAYCVEDDVFISNLEINYNDYISKQYIMFNQFKGKLNSFGIAFQGHLPLLMKANPTVNII